MKTCAKCGIEKQLSEFNNMARSKDGKHPYCRECSKAHYEGNKARHKENVKRVREAYKQTVRAWKYDYLRSVGCQYEGCCITDPIMLEFDHIDSDKKVATICDMIRRGVPLEKIIEEANKCRVLCANHHRLRTAEQMGWTSFILYN